VLEEERARGLERVRASAGNLLWWVVRLVFILCSKVSRQNTPMQFSVRAELVSLLGSENKMGNDKKKKKNH
jgi:hypothetical protein